MIAIGYLSDRVGGRSSAARCITHRSTYEKAEGIPEVEVRLLGFEVSAVALRAHVWSEDPRNVFKMHSDINKAIKKTF